MSVADITNPTDPATLPQWRGQPVPWVTMWTNESSAHRPYGVKMTPEGPMVTYGDDREVRDAFGMLWQREGITRGGDPEWRRVSTYRQRTSLAKRLCQVCGKKVTENPIQWLMPPDGIETMGDGTSLTMQPPTCEACIPLALDVCPNLKKRGWMLVHVLSYEPWGVLGEVLELDPVTDKPVRQLASVPYEGAGVSLKMVVARQLVVKLTKFRIAERSP